LLYGSGLRLLEALELRVKDVDFDCGEIRVRDGKGRRDRVTMLAAAVKAPPPGHLLRGRGVHEQDLRRGAGRAVLPAARARKEADVDKEWGWQWVFPHPRCTQNEKPGSSAGITFTRQ